MIDKKRYKEASNDINEMGKIYGNAMNKLNNAFSMIMGDLAKHNPAAHAQIIELQKDMEKAQKTQDFSSAMSVSNKIEQILKANGG